jgi:C_GCAxxG_C_C family probable redox protein
MLAVGEHALGSMDAQTLRMATGFSGGIGDARRDMCGALSSGIMIIGALHGRTRPGEDDSLCLKLTTGYRDRFARELGSINCSELRAERYGSQGEEPCSVLVERAARLLLAVLDGDENEDDQAE